MMGLFEDMLLTIFRGEGIAPTVDVKEKVSETFSSAFRKEIRENFSYKPTGIGESLATALSQPTDLAGAKARELSKLHNDGVMFFGFTRTLYVGYNTLYRLWQERKYKFTRSWINDEITHDELVERDGYNDDDHKASKAYFEQMMEYIVFNNRELGNLHWREFYKNPEVHKLMNAFAIERSGVPNSVWLIDAYKHDKSIQKKGETIEVHELDRGATSFGDGVSVHIYDKSGKKIETRSGLTIGDYRLEEGDDEPSTIVGEGAAADTAERSINPSDGNKALFEEEIDADRTIWRDNGTVEFIWVKKGAVPGKVSRHGRWDPQSNTLFIGADVFVRQHPSIRSDMEQPENTGPERFGRNIPAGSPVSPAPTAKHAGSMSKQRKAPRVRTGLPEIFDPTSPKYDMDASIVRRLELYQEARREEAVPVPGSKQRPAGRSLLTAAERHDTAKAGMRVPIAERHPPSRQQRYDKLGAHYAAMLRRAEGSGLEDAVQKDFVAAFIAASVDQDQRDRERDWAEQTKNDPEIGGRNLKRALKDAAYALDRFGDWELYGYLDDSGLGNHPDVIRLFSKAGAYARSQRAPEPPPPLEAGWEKRKRPRRLQWQIPKKVA